MNGSCVPYGYQLADGELVIAEDEAEVIRLIYDKFIHTNMGVRKIAFYLKQYGYKKKKRREPGAKNTKRTAWSMRIFCPVF